ncbi:MAG: hypothetical protein IJX99_04175 [Clostridia bacterium]|nr:hypothetical protein [Clostridia bacterium]
MKKKILICISILVVIGVWGFVLAKQFTMQSVKDNVNNGKIKIVTSLEDKIAENAAWCGTFNLIWNDLKNDLAKQDIKFAENSDIVDNLNKGTFTVNELSENSYYKKYGVPSLELKAEIEKAIKDKFNETSDILDDFNWENHTDEDYFLYSMLKKEFEYPKTFDKLNNGVFEQYDNVRYFGITGRTKDEVREQIDVLYYDSEDDFAIKIKTKSNDEIIVSVGNDADNFLDVYNNIMKKGDNYKDSKTLRDNDTFKMPYITFDLKEEITEVENKPFYFSNGAIYEISKALQTIQFEIDEKGGKIKSEAGMMVNKSASMIEQKQRKFNVDQAFDIFLFEEGRNLPYFAARITDISSVQSGTMKNENLAEEDSNTQNTGAYIPDGMEIASKDDVGTKVEDIIFNRNKENVTIEVLVDTVSSSGATIVITDKNEDPYGWGKSYKIEQKVDGEWKELKPKTEMIFEEIAYVLNENGQFEQDIDWTRFYGELENGTYRIVKDTYEKGYINFYSNEFRLGNAH